MHDPSQEFSAASPVSAQNLAKKRRRKNTGLNWIDDPYNPVHGETGLWIAVITQAFMDALSRSRNPEILYLKDQAIRWLTGNSKDFVEVCLLAGLHPDYVRRKAKKALLNPTAWRLEPGKSERYTERRARHLRNKQHKAPPRRSLPSLPVSCEMLTLS